ncbi:GDP-Man:Man3GlcNAc2-PP-dolichol alpha-1,2-mannosyltransferase [Malassezia sp. CBS 17886]|nr:GDP-Man:Man3GlcNAc2-PP-dolichol alpha-1,2-mannosyltransferase [Malassezia sp. CBS 17886]
MAQLLWEFPPAREVGRLALILAAVLVCVNFLATVAWRKALRDTNAAKRHRILQRLGIYRAAREPMFVGFLHPFCNAGGGGERVLYEAISLHQRTDPHVICVVYTGDLDPLPGGVTKTEMLRMCKDRFGIDLDETRIAFLPLRNRRMVEEHYWSRFTLLGQAYGGNRIALEALSQVVPDVFIDTMGYAFALPVVKQYSQSIRTGAYIHYPTVSTDMLARVRRREAGHTNAAWVAASWPLSAAKLVYYWLFAAAYGAALRNADAIAVNGTWTRNHIAQLLPRRVPRPWAMPPLPPVNVVYPPCDTRRLAELALESRAPRLMLSLAQFRPEKEHATQLHIVRAMLTRFPALRSSRGGVPPLKLCMIGGCRNAGDEARVAALRALADELGIAAHTEFLVNAPYATVLQKLGVASVGLSTMVDEHFGINVVEFMAAGLLTLSHASAGPLLDIAVPVGGEATGLHASSVEDFATRAHDLLTMSPDAARAMRARARTHVTTTLSNEAFAEAWRTKFWDVLVPAVLLRANAQIKEMGAAEGAGGGEGVVASGGGAGVAKGEDGAVARGGDAAVAAGTASASTLVPRVD